LFKKRIHLALARKLVEIGQLRNLDPLNKWYEKALSFERSRREAIKEFGGRKNGEFGRCEKKISFGRSEVRPQCNGHGQVQEDKEILQLWRNGSFRCKVLQTKEREKRKSENDGRDKGGFFLRQGVSTNLPALVDLKV